MVSGLFMHSAVRCELVGDVMRWWVMGEGSGGVVSHCVCSLAG